MPDQGVGKRIENTLERGIFAVRWLLAPVYVGLILALGVVVVTFFVALWDMITSLNFAHEACDAAAKACEDEGVGVEDITVAILSLIDITLVGNLILIVVFAGYENFVSKISPAHESEDRPTWIGHVDFSGLKMKLIGSLVAISAILLLKDFVKAGDPDAHLDFHAVGWQIGIHFTFVLSGLLFAFMDYWGAKRLKLLQEMHAADGHHDEVEPYDPAAS